MISGYWTFQGTSEVYLWSLQKSWWSFRGAFLRKSSTVDFLKLGSTPHKAEQPLTTRHGAKSERTRSPRTASVCFGDFFQKCVLNYLLKMFSFIQRMFFCLMPDSRSIYQANKWNIYWLHYKNFCETFLIKVAGEKNRSNLTLSWRRPLSYRNQPIDLQSKSMDWFLYNNGLRHERVKVILWFTQSSLLWKTFDDSNKSSPERWLQNYSTLSILNL